jgi:Ca-activated chloride channel family protein
MTFAWPWMLITLVALPFLVLRYRRLVARRASRADRLVAAGLSSVGAASARTRRGWVRHATPALFLAALALLLSALARPEAAVAQPHRDGTVILAFDVSSSMAADDVTPTRIEAAKAAARSFVMRQPGTIRVGVVAFGESGLIMQRPSTDRTSVLAAIDRLTPQGGTSLGRGMQTALSVIVGRTVQLAQEDGSVETTGPDLGYHGSAVVVLLTDGENTAAPDPLQVARIASGAGVKVFTIGLGSPQGAVLSVDGFQIATALDEPMLRQIASTTDGTYFSATDRQSLTRVYDSIHPTLTVEVKRIEITALFAGAAALLLLTGASLSLVRTGRVIQP